MVRAELYLKAAERASDGAVVRTASGIQRTACPTSSYTYASVTPAMVVLEGPGSTQLVAHGDGGRSACGGLSVAIGGSEHPGEEGAAPWSGLSHLQQHARWRSPSGARTSGGGGREDSMAPVVCVASCEP